MNTQRKSLNAAEILHTVVDQLISLSSMALVSVRDAVTEAALSIGQNLLHACGELKDQISIAQRQISAEETASKSSAALKSNPKYISCVKLRDASFMVSNSVNAFYTFVICSYPGIGGFERPVYHFVQFCAGSPPQRF